MKKIMRKAALILMFVMICCISYGSLRVSAAGDINDIGIRVISDINKTWTVKFKAPVDVTSLNNSVYVEDLTDGSTVKVSISKGDDDSSAKINPPSGGYKLLHSYKITVDKNAKSKNGQNLLRVAVLEFKLESKDSNKYNISANILVSPFIPTFKQINVSSTNLPSASKYKIEGSNMVDIGKGIAGIVPDDTVKVYLYDSRENLLGTAVVDVSSTKNNINMNIILEN